MPGKVIKFLSGPHLGAEVEVGDCPLTLGCGGGCDIIIDDRLAGDCHLTLACHNGGVVAEFIEQGYLQPAGAGSKVVAAGESVAVSDGDLIAIGSTYVSIGPAEGQWPQIPLPDWIALNGSTTTEAAEGKDSRGKESETKPGREAASTSAADVAAESRPQPASGKGRSKAGPFRWALPLAIVLVVGCLAAFLFIRDDAGRGPAGGKPVVPAKEVSAANAKGSLDEFCKTHDLNLETVNGIPRISGEVEGPDDVQEVRQQALALAPTADFRVYARSETVRAAGAVLSGYGYPITVKGVAGGVLSLDGWAPSQEDWERVLVDLSRDVPGVTQFDAAVLFLSSIQDYIGEDLRANGLDDVQVSFAGETLQCSGIMAADKQPAWKECLAKWQKQFNVIRTIKDETVLVASQEPEAPSAGDMKIASILFAPLRCFITASGDSFYEGAKLPDGNIVESIAETGVVLRRGDERKELALFTGGAPAVGDADGI